MIDNLNGLMILRLHIFFNHRYISVMSGRWNIGTILCNVAPYRIEKNIASSGPLLRNTAIQSWKLCAFFVYQYYWSMWRWFAAHRQPSKPNGHGRHFWNLHVHCLRSQNMFVVRCFFGVWNFDQLDSICFLFINMTIRNYTNVSSSVLYIMQILSNKLAFCNIWELWLFHSRATWWENIFENSAQVSLKPATKQNGVLIFWISHLYILYCPRSE